MFTFCDVLSEANKKGSRECAVRNANQRSLYCRGVNLPPNHPGGIALIWRKNKGLSVSQ